jgi:CDP-diacylglycerol---glycerol-3-phosphate 3-phosphatidyltransferase
MLNQTNARQIVAGVVEPAARGLLRLGISPDAITVLGLVGTCVGALVFFPQEKWLIGTAVVVLFIFSDLLDGTMARLSGRAGPWGAFLDSTLDRVGDAAILGGIAMGFVHAGDARTAAVAIGCLVGGLVVSYAKARAEGVGAECNVGIAERTERLIIQGIGVVLYGFGVPYALPAALWILLVLTWVTVGQRIWHVRGQLHPMASADGGDA